MLIPFSLYIWRMRCTRRRFNLVRAFLDLFSGHHGLQTLFEAASGGLSTNTSAKAFFSQGFHHLKKM
ncbi:MAG: hypothetical protein PHD82_06455 [Candidatus Riflebacteria bacterium]|nr:hypothetical protein [Candidatus Riflebacteria bacterium]